MKYYIKEAREAAGYSQKQLAEMCGVAPSTFNGYETGVHDPKSDTLIKIARAVNVSVDYLLGNTAAQRGGQVISFDTPTSEERTMLQNYRTLDTYGKEAVDAVLGVEYRRMTKLADPKREGWTTYIKYFDLAVSAGTGEPWMDAAHATRLAIPTEKVPEKANFCVRVNGSSMEPAYKDGDIVFVQHAEDGELREGEIGVFLLNGEGYIKRLGDGALISLNPEYEPISLHDYDSFRCQGRVLGKL